MQWHCLLQFHKDLHLYWKSLIRRLSFRGNDFTDFDITFINKLNTSEVLTVTMHKAASKPKFAEATGGAKSDFNEAPVIADYASTASMYKAGNRFTIYCQPFTAGDIGCCAFRSSDLQVVCVGCQQVDICFYLIGRNIRMTDC